MAKPIAEFKQGPRPNNTTDLMKIAQSESDPTAIYIQLVKQGYQPQYGTRAKDKVMHFKIRAEDIDDICVVLQYAKKVIVEGENK